MTNVYRINQDDLNHLCKAAEELSGIISTLAEILYDIGRQPVMRPATSTTPR
jgi:hypothetical protein